MMETAGDSGQRQAIRWSVVAAYAGTAVLTRSCSFARLALDSRLSWQGRDAQPSPPLIAFSAAKQEKIAIHAAQAVEIVGYAKWAAWRFWCATVVSIVRQISTGAGGRANVCGVAYAFNNIATGRIIIT